MVFDVTAGSVILGATTNDGMQFRPHAVEARAGGITISELDATL